MIRTVEDIQEDIAGYDTLIDQATDNINYHDTERSRAIVERINYWQCRDQLQRELNIANGESS